jgi:hypothetical protein
VITTSCTTFPFQSRIATNGLLLHNLAGNIRELSSPTSLSSYKLHPSGFVNPEGKNIIFFSLSDSLVQTHEKNGVFSPLD